MLIRFTGPVADGRQATYQEYSFYDLFYSELQTPRGREAVGRPGRVPRQDRHRRHDRRGPARPVHGAVLRGQDAGHAGAREHHRQPALAALHATGRRRLEPAGAGRLRAGGRCRRRVAGRVVGGGHRGRSRPGGRLGVARAVRPGRVDGGGGPGAGRGVRHLRRHGLPVPRRRAREAAGQADVLALRVPGRLRAADGRPVERAPRRRAARHVRPVRGHPRLHDVHRAGPPRGGGGAAQRVLLAHGGGGVRPPRHGGQVRRRHGDGALRRAARRSRPRGPRGAGGARRCWTRSAT